MSKRLIFSLLLLLVTCSMGMSQKIGVDSFAPIASDLYASIHRRNDNNEVACALIKVHLARPGAIFNGNVYGEVEYDHGEYYVYMMNGSKMLQVKLDGFTPLDLMFADYDIASVQSLTTYRLVLTLPNVVGQPEDDGKSYFTLTVNPPNASLLLDGKLYALDKDGMLSDRLPRGHHSYQLIADGYAAKQGSFTLGTERKDLKETLIPVQATLTVTCPTPDVDIYLNEEKRANGSSWSGTLKPGSYLVEARKNGYFSQQKSFTLTENQSLNIDLPALLARTGTLDVNYKPFDSEVWIDGAKAGTAPDMFKNLSVGNHRVEIRKEGYDSKTETVNIKEGQISSMIGTLTTSPLVADTSSVSLSSIKGYKRCPDNHHPHLIDLGLPSGTLWSCCNVGANCPEQSGGYYAWGETETKKWYDWSFYKYSKGEKDNIFLGDNIAGTEYDVALAQWGDSWQMPTRAQMQELIDNCKSEWTKRNYDVLYAMEESGPGYNYGVQMTGKNGGFIFLPAAGFILENEFDGRNGLGTYWTSTGEKGSGNDDIYYMFNNAPEWVADNSVPYWGHNVRPVGTPASSSVPITSALTPLPFVSCPDDHHPHMIDLGLPSGIMWSCCNVGANNPAEYGGYYAWGETEEKNVYEWNNYKYLNNSKNCIFIGKNISGTKYDAAHVKWGGSWQMPSKEQFAELTENCSFEWIVKDWIVGMLIIGKNGNTIFLPAAGSFGEGCFDGEGFSGAFWTSTNSVNGVNYAVPFHLSKTINGVEDLYFRRIHGHNIRAISH